MSKILILVIIAVVVIGGITLWLGKSKTSSTIFSPSNTIFVETPKESLSVVSPTISSSPMKTALPTKSIAPVNNIIIYTDFGFSPNRITIKSGQSVTWKNKSSNQMWVGSDPHPIHSGYPISGGCISSVFDSCQGLVPGETWSFKFDIVGNWGYHNHLDSGVRSTVIVQ